MHDNYYILQLSEPVINVRMHSFDVLSMYIVCQYRLAINRQLVGVIPMLIMVIPV